MPSWSKLTIFSRLLPKPEGHEHKRPAIFLADGKIECECRFRQLSFYGRCRWQWASLLILWVEEARRFDAVHREGAALVAFHYQIDKLAFQFHRQSPPSSLLKVGFGTLIPSGRLSKKFLMEATTAGIQITYASPD
jgi:hypothetical protein